MGLSLAACEKPAPAPAAAGADRYARILGDLHAAATCDDPASAWRGWCIAADGWSKGTAAPLPDGVLSGRTVELQDGVSVADALAHHVVRSAFAVRHDGGETLARITYFSPSHDGEAVAASYPMTASGAGWIWPAESAAEARKFGDVWVTIEVPDKQNGYWISIFTETTQAR